MNFWRNVLGQSFINLATHSDLVSMRVQNDGIKVFWSKPSWSCYEFWFSYCDSTEGWKKSCLGKPVVIWLQYLIQFLWQYIKLGQLFLGQSVIDLATLEEQCSCQSFIDMATHFWFNFFDNARSWKISLMVKAFLIWI